MKPNIIPELTEMRVNARAPNLKSMKEMEVKINSCIDAAAAATGCKVLTFLRNLIVLRIVI